MEGEGDFKEETEDVKVFGLESEVILSTNGHYCVLCLKLFSEDRRGYQPDSIQILLEKLKINLDKIVSGMVQASTVGGGEGENGKGNALGSGVTAMSSVCLNCEKVVKRYLKLWEEVQKMSMEMDYCLEVIGKCIWGAEENSGGFEGCRKLMNDSIPSILMAAFLDELRKAIYKKCLSTRHSVVQPQLKLNRVIIEEMEGGPLDNSNGGTPPQLSRDSPMDSANQSPQEVGGDTEELGEDPPYVLKPSFRRNKITGKYHCHFPSCKKAYNYRSSVNNHYCCIHLKKPRRAKKQRQLCGICNSVDFANQFTLRNHEKFCKKTVTCGKCKKPVTSQTVFLIHKKICPEAFLEFIEKDANDPNAESLSNGTNVDEDVSSAASPSSSFSSKSQEDQPMSGEEDKPEIDVITIEDRKTETDDDEVIAPKRKKKKPKKRHPCLLATCSEKFRKKITAVNHFRRDHKRHYQYKSGQLSFKVDSKSLKVVCPEDNCSTLFANKKRACIHYKSAHLKIRWKCKTCKMEEFKLPILRKQHQMFCGKTKACPNCLKQFSSYKPYKRHQKLCNGQEIVELTEEVDTTSTFTPKKKKKKKNRQKTKKITSKKSEAETTTCDI